MTQTRSTDHRGHSATENAPVFTRRTVPAANRIPAAQRSQRMRQPGFGRVLTEHMVTIRWSADLGWHDARLDPYQDLRLDPASVGLHHGQIVFEGLKAYSQPDGGVGVFRPDLASERLRRSARRLAMPELPESLFLAAITELVGADRDWVPATVGSSLYLRPVLLATESDLGLRPAREYLFLLIAFVTDNFFPGEVSPLTVWVSGDYVRAAPGGTGEAKTPGNYAGSLLPAQEAKARGCDQVVWLDAVERRWIEELGGMNLFFVYGPPDSPRLITPPLGGTILPGVTRDALITLARGSGYAVDEQPLSITEWRSAAEDGSMAETFACGTAAVVAPVGTVRSTEGEWQVGGGVSGPVTLGLRRALVDIQHGLSPDHHGWVFPVR
ncbi:branched-chain amino acid aminotransferase [Actinoalloteichus hymeniacidonis]|uniref:Branched-chain-amino-acid aminotransferase n=1 Tax=Actinoalloteichus hymeniacidonis TaxID=340345 RepID=A0AAC9HRU9_9PSEU|nr:branched-chain amino acid aminotransferase [Actinoalloteichus hymeniacidonis]AOS64061.1 branched-chain amino acid aminotransferase, group II [Actinoalloteichus hymeniacidonis]MBB5907877.1 branched-chain amino acid aminotransferase [Actinoalloteichus hymeniacidonis]